jgi:hypothetical protein
MAGKAWAWLVAFGLLGGSAGAQEEEFEEDIPDNMPAFRQTPLTDDSPVTAESGEEPGVGGSGTAGTGEARRGELSGEVVRVQGNQLFLRHAGAVFPLELTEETRFSPDRRQALQPGQEVRARFTLEGGNYVVDALEPLGQKPAGHPSPGKKQETEKPEAPKQ